MRLPRMLTKAWEPPQEHCPGRPPQNLRVQLASGCHLAENVSEYQRGSLILIVLEVGGGPAPDVVRWLTETKLPTWRVLRFPSRSKESPHAITGVPIPTHFLGGECCLACTRLLEREIFNLYSSTFCTFF